VAKSGSFASRLYSGDVSYQFIGRRRIWYAISGFVLLVSVLSLIFRGIHPSIEFKGGAVFEAPANGHSVSQAKSVFTKAGVTPEIAQKVGEGQLRIQTGAIDPTDPTKTTRLQQGLAKELGVSSNEVAVRQVGPSWGGQITKKAVQGLVIFLALLFVVLSIRYEPKMALAAFIALIHDIVITAGVYSLVGFEVSPGTVIALLTILGYSLYDTVVVFDKVQENTKGLAGGSRTTYSGAANLALNQTLVRSINTSIIGLLPVASLLFIGAGLLKAGTLKDLALALFIGLLCGTYSSIFTATPLLCEFKEREPAMRALARRVEGRRATDRSVSPAGVSAGTVSAARAGGAAGVLVDSRDGSGGDNLTAGDIEDDQLGADRAAADNGGTEPVVATPYGNPGVGSPAAGRPPRPHRKSAARGRTGRPSGKRRR
jgi:preprotein translocase subunit SecF